MKVSTTQFENSFNSYKWIKLLLKNHFISQKNNSCG